MTRRSETLVIIGSVNGLVQNSRQTIACTNDDWGGAPLVVTAKEIDTVHMNDHEDRMGIELGNGERELWN